jgi:hypothetical protein
LGTIAATTGIVVAITVVVVIIVVGVVVVVIAAHNLRVGERSFLIVLHNKSMQTPGCCVSYHEREGA